MARTPPEPEPVEIVEGPPTPGIIPDEPADEDLSVAELRAEAEAKGVLPDEGTGSGGRVVRADLEAALEHAPPDPPAGRPPLVLVAEAAARTLQTVIDRKD